MRAHSLWVKTLGALAFFVAFQRLFSRLVETGALHYGALPTDYLLPLLARPDLKISKWLLPPLVVAACYFWVTDRLLASRKDSPRLLIALAGCCFVAIALSVSMIDGFQLVNGTRSPSFIVPFSRTNWEYFGDVPLVDELGVLDFLGHYSSSTVFPKLSLHSQTHPPGPALLLWGVSKVFGAGLLPASLVAIGLTAIVLLPVWLLTKDLYGGLAARYAIALLVVTPNLVLFSATSMDGPFCVLPSLAVWAFFRSMSERPIFYGVFTGLFLAAGMFMTYATTFTAAFFLISVVLVSIFARKQVASLLLAQTIGAVTFLTLYLLLFVFTGFDLPQAVATSLEHARHQMPYDHSSFADYLGYSFSNLLAFLFGCGVVLAVIWSERTLCALRDSLAGKPLDIFTSAAFASLLVMSFSTLYTGETDRIWIFLAPFIVVPSAHYLATNFQSTADHGRLFSVTALLWIQVITMEVFLTFPW